jgi:hypothetical protein
MIKVKLTEHGAEVFRSHPDPDTQYKAHYKICETNGNNGDGIKDDIKEQNRDGEYIQCKVWAASENGFWKKFGSKENHKGTDQGLHEKHKNRTGDIQVVI